ncbi:MAG TPA: Fic family protein [Ilumatobacteraceae bacterium]|nr:Fic family protein [Ilumatobacteraceae bacterium]
MDNDIVFASDLAASTLANRVTRGELRRIVRGIYTTDLTHSLEEIVNRNWAVIVGRSFPDAVITDRSAITGGKVGGYLYLAHDARERELALPGLTVIARRGAGPLPGDVPMPGGLVLASTARALVDNTADSRSRGGRPRRTLDSAELDDWIDRRCRLYGEGRLAADRQQAEALADSLSASANRISDLNRRIGMALGSRDAASGSRSLAARAAGHPYDPDRIERFDTLVAALRSTPPQSRRGLDPGSSDFLVQSFYEAYFSNYIEGTTFTVDEARSIVYEARPIPNRAADSHDVLGTYRIVSDPEEMRYRADSADEFIDLLRSRHALPMGGRPEIAGEFKTKPNQAGQTLFVAPELVAGTLAEGWRRLAQLDTAWERSVYAMFLVSEVHPFPDGNGRVARVMMNAELVAGNQSKIIVPTGYRSEYLGALRRISRDDDPTIYIKALRYLHDYTSQVDWSSDGNANADLMRTNAFAEEDDAPRLTLPRTVTVDRL